VGLDHVQDKTQLSYPTPGYRHGYAAGNLRGLANLGAGSCHPEI